MISVLLVALLAAEKLSPFTAVQVEGDIARVQFDGAWHELVELDGLPTAKILAYCRKTYDRKASKRFAEDLVEVLTGMGRQPGRTISMVLKDPKTGKLRKVAQAPMTHDNRRKVRDARQAPPRAFSARDAAADIAFLREFLGQRHSYRFVRPKGMPEGTAATRNELALHIARSIARFGDGHTRVRGRWDWLPKGYAPFRAQVCGKRLVAVDPIRGKFISRRFPYLEAIDGIEIARWLEAAAWVAQGSAQYRLWRGAEELAYLAALRRELKLPANPNVKLKLADERGRTNTISLALQTEFAVSPPLARKPTRMLDKNIGYLRLAKMGADPGPEKALVTFANARGIIIDVRGNGGGSRDALRALLPYFLDRPRVVNVASYRLPEGVEDDQGHLGNRFCYPQSWNGWSDKERGVIIGFNRGFRPEYEPDREFFTAMHYMVVKPGEHRIRRKVVVLMNGGCFSATDIFLGAFKGVRGVTLLGTASGGGSGRSRKVTLPRSGIKLRVSTMLSYRPDGKFYDGHGIEPDVAVDAIPTDWIGETDTQLDAAVKLLSR
ncbi:MAG: S41 family peptidase [Planctomycetota bacterium]|jgi:hypothetical protein